MIVTASYVAFVIKKSEKGKAKGSATKSGLVQSGCGNPSRRIPLYVVNTTELEEDMFHMVESKVAVLVSVVLSILRFVALTVSRPVEKNSLSRSAHERWNCTDGGRNTYTHK